MHKRDKKFELYHYEIINIFELHMYLLTVNFNLTDEADDASNMTRSKMPTDAALDEKFKILQHAEEVYFRSKGPSKQVRILLLFNIEVHWSFSFS